jgi:hypothetical protein
MPWRRISGLIAALAVGSILFPREALAESFCIPGPGDRPEMGLQGATHAEELMASGGFAGHWCGARKVGQHALYNRGSFGDLQVIVGERGDCAYASMRDPSDLDAPTTGTVVLDVSVASRPRDVAVLRTPAMRRAYSALEIPVAKSARIAGNLSGLGDILVGAFKDFGPSGTNPFDVYDVSGDCLSPRFLSSTNTASGNHDGWVTPDGRTYYGVPFGGRTIQQEPNRIDLHVMDLTDRSNPRQLLNWNRNQLPAAIRDRLVPTRNFHDVSTNDAGTRVYLALYGGNNALGGFPSDGSGRCANGLLILDSSDIALGRPNPQLSYISFLSWCDPEEDPAFHYYDPDFEDGATAAAHATEYVIHENGREYIVTTDESGGGLAGHADGMCAHKSYARFIDISDEARPRVVSTFKPDVNKPEHCERNRAEHVIGGMIHYIGFDDRYATRLVVYAGADYGMRFVDFRDPERPKEIAYYKKEAHVAADDPPAQLHPNFTTGSTPAGELDFTRPDPRYDAENCLWYTGWNQGGLVTIELTHPEYNPCLRRHASGGGWLARAGPGKINLTLDVKRSAGGRGTEIEGGLEVNDRVAGAKILLNRVTFLGSLRDSCGDVSARQNAVQFEGNGTYNGKAASFRACVRDNGSGRQKGGSGDDDFFLTCTAGCLYSVGGKLGAGDIQVLQRP